MEKKKNQQEVFILPLMALLLPFIQLGLYHAAVCDNKKKAIPYESHCTIVTLTLNC